MAGTIRPDAVRGRDMLACVTSITEFVERCSKAVWRFRDDDDDRDDGVQPASDHRAPRPSEAADPGRELLSARRAKKRAPTPVSVESGPITSVSPGMRTWA
jgi:hypothetical protein